jgi:hypothetical protein
MNPVALSKTPTRLRPHMDSLGGPPYFPLRAGIKQKHVRAYASKFRLSQLSLGNSKTWLKRGTGSVGVAVGACPRFQPGRIRRVKGTGTSAYAYGFGASPLYTAKSRATRDSFRFRNIFSAVAVTIRVIRVIRGKKKAVHRSP